MYRAFYQFGASLTNQDLIPDAYGGGAVPALILNNEHASDAAKFQLMSPQGLTFDVVVPPEDSKIVEISTRRVVGSPADTSIVILTQ
tara:strand:- start:980 stop:1240 length:261 start_codon:yes stop_codon:yes gene_type:complete